jgi:tetratricopeptide (TPR) repeat protein
MHVFWVAILFASAAADCCAQEGKISDWTKLIDKKDCTQAKDLCTRFSESAILSERVESQKCLANVALCGNDIVFLEGNETGGGSIHGSYKPEAVAEALTHLGHGIELAPQDLTIHLGRLHILEVSGRYEQMVKALDESCTLYHGKDAPNAWLAYAPELADLGQLSAGVDFMKVLDKHYPNNSDIISNIGAFLSMQKEFSKAIPYLQKSVELAPKDPMNAWDLGHAYEYTEQIELADKWYTKALSLPQTQDVPGEARCLYAEFVEKKLKDLPRACTLEKANCEKEKQAACAPAALAPTPAH